jgi:hypothetical protein
LFLWGISGFLWGIEIYLIINLLDKNKAKKRGFYGEFLAFYGELKSVL